jgi:uncharacterized membrane protein (UPF0127 family)
MKNDSRDKYFIVVAIALALLFVALYFRIGQAPAVSSLDKTFNVTRIVITHGNTTSMYYVYIAQNLYQQELGYMNQTSLGDCAAHSPCLGMLFQFQNTSDYCFWMENTEIPLKQVWISQNGTVIYEANATPYSVQNICHVGISVLETSPNQAIAPGDKITVLLTG